MSPKAIEFSGERSERRSREPPFAARGQRHRYVAWRRRKQELVGSRRRRVRDADVVAIGDRVAFQLVAVEPSAAVSSLMR
jgi:hypothetical protein